MCMIAAGVTKDYGVIASDSATYKEGVVGYETPKMFKIHNYLITYIGFADYFSGMDNSKFTYGIPSLCVYLENYLVSRKNSVRESLEKLSDKPNANLCLFLMGIHNGKPTLVQFNSFNDFKPEFMQSEKALFSSIFYGDEGHKQWAFNESSSKMQDMAVRWEGIMSPGIMGEILTRGIHLKCDIEEEASHIKYAGGCVSVASISSSGEIKSMSNVYL